MIEEELVRRDPLRISIRCASGLLGVSRSGYYDWKARGAPMHGSSRDESLLSEIQRIIVEYVGYGYRRVTAQLHRDGFRANHKRVLRIMRTNGLIIAKRRFHPQTTDSNHDRPVYPNLIMNVEIDRPNQVWASDITYIRIEKGFVYLAAILDLYTRRVIGWSLRPDLRARLATEALLMAIESRNVSDYGQLIHHSDRGCQYASEAYTNILMAHGIRISMSRKGNPYDNAYVESFFKTLKCEEVYLNEYRTFQDVLENIEEFIENVYNTKRMHSALGYKSPVEFEMEVALNSVA